MWTKPTLDDLLRMAAVWSCKRSEEQRGGKPTIAEVARRLERCCQSGPWPCTYRVCFILSARLRSVLVERKISQALPRDSDNRAYVRFVSLF